MTYELTRRRVLGALGIATAAGGVVSTPATAQTASASGWPQRRYDAGNTNYNPAATGPTAAPETTTLLQRDTELAANLLVTGETLYTQQGLGTLAVQAESGTEQWVRYTEDPAGGGLPVAVAHGHVYVLTPTGVVAALDAESGDTLWRHAEQGIPSVAATDDVVYVTVGRTLAAVEPDGSERWQRELDAAVRGSATDGETVYLTTESGVLAVDGGDATTRWRHGFNTLGLPVVSSGQVYVRLRTSEQSLELLALNATDGQQVWRADDLPPVLTSPPAVAGPQLYIGAGTDAFGETFHAVSALTGDIQWSTELGNPTSASASPAASRPAATEGTIYVTSADGTLNAIGASSGEHRWREPFDTTPGPPVPVADRLYLPLGENEIVVVEGTAEPDDQGNGGNTGQSDDDSGTDDGGSADAGGENETESASDDGSGPGFGVAGALAGLGGAYLLRRRREDQV